MKIAQINPQRLFLSLGLMDSSDLRLVSGEGVTLILWQIIMTEGVCSHAWCVRILPQLKQL